MRQLAKQTAYLKVRVEGRGSGEATDGILKAWLNIHHTE
jgi:hypothetical protein